MNKPIPFGKYYLLERINVGGMAEVFKAKAVGVEGFERLVAVKRILPNIAEDEEFITMFIDEAKIAVQLQHANIAQIFDLGKVDDSYFIALEYVHGKDLRAIFDHLRKTDGSMPMPQACFMIMQVCEGLDYAHNKRDPQGRELNLVHRDVSPQNVLIGYEGEVKLVDFGIAKAAGKASKTQAGILKGKFGYMSPEQVRGLPVDRRSDIFSLGIVLYELLTGERLFVGESDFSTLEKVRNVEILPPSSFNKKLPAELERIVLKALAKDVEDRYQNAIDLHDDLQAFLYSVGEFYSRKDLSAWMKRTFGSELAEENAKLEEYEHFDKFEEPTPPPKSVPGVAPVRPGSRVGSAPRASAPSRAVQARGGSQPRSAASAAWAPARAAGGAQGGLEWDDEELETQIFDKPPDHEEAHAGDDELTSGDIVLQAEEEDLDDKTVAGAPPAELLAEAEGGLPAPRGPGVQRTLAPMGGRAVGGPPPGLSAFRHPTPPPGAADGFGHPGGRPFDGAGSRATFEQPPARATYRQTLTGLPPAAAPYPAPVSAIPERRPLEHLMRPQKRSRAPLYVALIALVAGGGYGGYKYFTRPGKLQIMVKPVDAQITVDGQAFSGTVLTRPPGPYHVAVEREGYVRKDQNVEIQAGQYERLDIELEPSPDTGFELTSEPPGGLVWLDGQPFTSGDENAQQARTNFKAYRVAPGRHVLEIKNDPRFEDWQYEFIQEPGKTMKIHAELRPRGSAAATAPPKPAPAPEPVKAAEPPPPAPEPRREPPRPVVATPRPTARPASRPTRTAAVEAPARRVSDEDVFEKETTLGRGGAAEDCTVTLGAKPNSEVFVDGKRVGWTPVVDFKLPCGRHKVTFKNPELKIDRTENIQVRAGEKFKKVFQLVDTEE